MTADAAKSAFQRARAKAKRHQKRADKAFAKWITIELLLYAQKHNLH